MFQYYARPWNRIWVCPIEDRGSRAGNGSSVHRVSLTFTASKCFFDHESVGLVQKAHDGLWEKTFNGHGVYETIGVKVDGRLTAVAFYWPWQLQKSRLKRKTRRARRWRR
jgi:hypothetical protein